jgi:hypothetical protein
MTDATSHLAAAWERAGDNPLRQHTHIAAP